VRHPELTAFAEETILCSDIRLGFYPAPQQPSHLATQLPSYPATQPPSNPATQLTLPLGKG